MDQGTLTRWNDIWVRGAAIYAARSPVGRVLSRSLTAIAFVLAIGNFWALLGSRFVPSPLGEKLSLAVAIAAAGCCVALTLSMRAIDPAAARLAPTPSWTTRIAFAAMVFVFAFLGMQAGFLDLWTLATGQPGRETVHANGYWSGHAGDCGGVALSEAPLLIGPSLKGYIPDKDAAPPGTPLELRGRATPFGFAYDAFRIPLWGAAPPRCRYSRRLRQAAPIG